jgi:type I restriction enzyme S subunit
MTFEVYTCSLNEVVEVTDYVANGSFASLKENVNYLEGDGYAVLVRLVDHNSSWKGEKVFVDERAYRFLSKSSLSVGDIVVANVGANAGSVFRIPDLGKPLTLGPNAVRVRPRASCLNRLDQDYLYYYLTSPVGQSGLQSIITGSAQPKFNKTSLRSLKFIFPSIEQQNSISALMKGIDTRINLLRETNATLEAIAQALFKSWFVNFDPVRAKVEGLEPEGMDAATAALFPDSFEESELGGVPTGWMVRSLDSIANYLNGVAMQKFPPTDDGWLPVIKIAQLRKGNTVGADRAGRNIKAEYIIQNGDVLFSWSGSLEVVIWCGGEGALNQHLFKVTSKDFPKWFYYLWTRQHLTNFQQTAASKATTMGHIQRKHLTEAKVVVPPSEMLRSAGVLIEPLLEHWLVNAEKAQTLSQLRDTLLPRLISGQMRLPEAEVMVEEVSA